MPSAAEPLAAELRLMIDGLSGTACVPARVLRAAGRGVMIDFVRGWRQLRVDDDGFLVQVGFDGSLLDIGGGWDAVTYAEGNGIPMLKRTDSLPVPRGLMSSRDNVLLINFQEWKRR